MRGVAERPTPISLETLRKNLRLRHLSCSPLLMRYSCNTDNYNQQQESFLACDLHSQLGPSCLERLKVCSGVKGKAVWGSRSKGSSTFNTWIMSVSPISHAGTNAIQENLLPVLHSQLVGNSGMEETDFRSNEDLNTNYYMRKIKITPLFYLRNSYQKEGWLLVLPIFNQQ